MRYLSALICLFLLVSSKADKKMTPEEYIAKYKDIAISEMHRTGIPASITLAQGYLESSYGNSQLATKANNHFGIKCHDGWTGDTFYIIDDDKDENGKLIKSCFRVYKNAEDSYYDHSEFLTGRSRYAKLFDLRSTDYEGWAKGLKKCGYATNPKYADLLINIVERYELYNYDKVKKPKKLLAHERLSKSEVFEINGIPAISYDGNMTIREIRDQFFTAEWQIFKYNDFTRKTPLKKGQIIYLKPKRKKNTTQEVHEVQEGETMQYISQLRGVKLKRLYKLNKLKKGEEPKAGEKLSLVKPRAIKPATGNSNLPHKYFSIDDEDQLYVSAKDVETPAGGTVADKNTIEKEDGLYHKVGPGETLMSISRAYDLTWLELKEQNGLTTDNLEVGQLLLIEPRAEANISSGGNDEDKETDETEVEETPDEPENTETEASENETESSTESNYSETDFHTVVKGETLFSISRLYGLTVAELMRINKLEGPAVKEGSTLRVKP